MREQAIASRGTRRVAAAGREFVQRPARRESGRPEHSPLRAVLGYVPTAMKFVGLVMAIIAIVIGYRAAASASLFQVKTIDISGTSRTSADEISSLTRRAVSKTGVWRADLAAISTELERLPGIRRAVVTRVLPDGLRVRIIERVPVAVVRNAAGHFVWVDEDGVALGEMKPADHMPNFFIRGWGEDDNQDARQENAERVKKYLELTRDWDAAGLSERVSEVSLIDLSDIRAQLAGNDSEIEVRLGAQDPGPRLKLALELLDDFKQRAPNSSVIYVDMTQRQPLIGQSSGAKFAADRSGSDPASSPTVTPAKPPAVAAPARAVASDRSPKNANTRDKNKDDRHRSARDGKSNKNSAARTRRER